MLTFESRSDGWKCNSKNSVTGVNASVNFKSYLIDVQKTNKDKKDRASLCVAFKRMIDDTERKYACFVVALVTDEDGGSSRGQKDTGIERPWLFIPPCCAHQVKVNFFEEKMGLTYPLVSAHASRLFQRMRRERSNC